MERLWAFKRINYLLDDSDPQKPCSDGIDETTLANERDIPSDDEYDYSSLSYQGKLHHYFNLYVCLSLCHT